MPVRNRYVGGLAAALNEGGGSLYAPQQELVIEGNEWGRKETTRRYLLWNRKYAELVPAAGEPPLDPPDMDLSFLGKHTERFTRNGHAPGIATMDVVYRGALFPDYEDDDPDAITQPWSPPLSSQQEQVTFGFGDFSVSPVTFAAKVLLDYLAINLHFQYMSRSEPVRPRFVVQVEPRTVTLHNAGADELQVAGTAAIPIGSTVQLVSQYDMPGGLLPDKVYYVVSFVVAGGNSVVKLSATRGGAPVDLSADEGDEDHLASLVVIFGGSLPVIQNVSAIRTISIPGESAVGADVSLPAGALDHLRYVVKVTEFSAQPCGRYWEVLETGTLRIEGPPPETYNLVAGSEG